MISIQVRVNLVKNIESCGCELLEREDERNCRHGAFATARTANHYRRLVRKLDEHVYAAREAVFRILQPQCGGAAAGEFREVSSQVCVDFLEGFHEDSSFLGFDFIHELNDGLLFSFQLVKT